jgi:carboxyl-terminal processing protease
VKITTKLYYNLNNNSFQKNGIEPDIMLPDFLENIDDTEKTLSYSILPEKITKQAIFSKNKSFSIDNLKKENLTKISDDKNFKQLISMNQELKKYFNNSVEMPLNIKNFVKYMNREFDLIDLFGKNLKRTTLLFKVENNSFDKEINKIDSYQRNIDDILFEEIQNDIYIEATYRIINDFINLKN